MANLADCVFAVSKKDIPAMEGALRKAREDEKCLYITKDIYEKDGEKYEYLFKWKEGESNSCKLRKNGVTIAEASGQDTGKVTDMLKDMNHVGFEQIKDITVDNGWLVDWVKLKTYSYEYTPSIHEFEDHVTVYFGGRWSFPSNLIDSLDNYGVLWQGAGCEDGCDWQDDEMGNTDFGLRVKRERSEWKDDDGNYIYQHYVEDTSI